MRLSMAVALSIFTGGVSISLAVAEQPDRQVAVDTLSEVTNPPIYPPAAASMHIGGTASIKSYSQQRVAKKSRLMKSKLRRGFVNKNFGLDHHL